MDQLDQYSSSELSAPQMSARTTLDDREGVELFSSADTPLSPLRFPGEDDGRSLAETAKRDLDAALQLLAERAQHVTGASGAAIALAQGDTMVCRASSGPSAPKLGAPMEVNSGLVAQSLRTRQVVRCRDVAGDPRVNGKSCQALGIASAMAMPLLREQAAVGVFELLSTKVNAFGERDIAALERLGEMILTALDHSDAANRAHNAMHQNARGNLPEELEAVMHSLESKTVDLPAADSAATDPLDEKAESGMWSERGNIGKCTACGFPVSEGRTLCLDCSSSRNPNQTAEPTFMPGFPDAMDLPAESATNWLQSHAYLIGAILVTAATVAVALWFR